MADMELDIKRLLIDALELEDMQPEDIGSELPLFGDDGLGLDSIDALEIGVAIRKKYQVKLEANDAGNREHFRTVASLARFVEPHTADALEALGRTT